MNADDYTTGTVRLAYNLDGDTGRVHFATSPQTGLTWYGFEGGHTVNATPDQIAHGMSAYDLQDVDCFTLGAEPIEGAEQLAEHVAEFEEYLKEAHG